MAKAIGRWGELLNLDIAREIKMSAENLSIC